MDKYLSDKIKILSFIVILMILLLHSYNLPLNYEKNYIFYIEDFITNGITRIAVPFFFSISGFLFFNNTLFSKKKYLIKLNKRIKSLLIPYLFWSLLSIVLIIIINLFFFKVGNISINTFYDFIYYLILHPIPFQLWFLKDLFIMALISPLIYWILKKSSVFFLLFLFVIWFNNYQIFVIIDNETALFFTFGSYYSLKNSSQIKFKSYYLLVILFLWLSVIILKYEDDFIIRKLYLHRISQLLGLYFMWFSYDYISFKYNHKQIFEQFLKYSKFSFFIFLFHEPLFSIVKTTTLGIIKYEFLYLLTYFLYPFFIFILSLKIGNYLKMNFKHYKIITGGR